MAVALQTHGLGIGYPGNPVGRGLDIEIADAKVTMLLGPNGCGKTTLFRTMLGLLPAQGGRVSVGGTDLGSLGRNDVARRIAYVPQVAQGYFPFSVIDVVLMGRTPYLGTFERPGKKDFEIAEAALDEVGLTDFADRPFTAISGGQRQLVLIARALAQAAPVLIMDEPTANLDYANQHRVMLRARALADAGRTVIISTHNPDHAFAYAAHAILMKAGEIIAVGEVYEMLDSEKLSDVYELPVSVTEIDAGPNRKRRIVVPKEST